MARRSKVDAEKTRARILASALTLFSNKGYEHTTFTDIAARLKMTKGAVYWHFASKEALLVALVDLALEKFGQQISAAMPTGELTFPAVAGMMVENAVSVAKDPRSAAFFRLMKCQIRWSDASMASVREDLLSNKTFGPKTAFRHAIRNDVKAGRARAVDVEEVSTVALALWDGLVQAKIDGFLVCDLKKTLSHSYDALWKSIRAR